MARKSSNRSLLIGADSNRLAAVAAIFWRQDQLFLLLVVVAFRPSVITALLQLDNLLRGQFGALFDRVELGPVLRELIAAMLRDIEPPRLVEPKSLAITYAGRVPLGRREGLISLVGIVAPDASPRFQLRTGIVAARQRHAIVRLAGVGGGSKVDEQVALRVNDKRVHRMITGQRHAGQHRLRPAARRDLALCACIANDLVVQFRVNRAVIERDAGAAGGTRRLIRAKTLDHICLTGASRVL